MASTPPTAEPTAQTEATDSAQTVTLPAEELNQLQEELRVLKNDKEELERLRQVDADLTHFNQLIRLQVDTTLEDWSSSLLIELVPFVKGLQAALFMMDEASDGTRYLRRIGGYALPEAAPERMALGEGVTGQAATTGREMYYDSSAQFRAHTNSSLAEIEANVLYVLPLLQNDEVEGVLEITALSPLDEGQKALLRRLGEHIAGNLVTLRNQVQIRELLNESQEKQEALQAQEEEMRQNVEELEATQEEMKRVQQEIQQSENRLRSLLESIPMGILVLEPNQKIYFLNETGRSLLGQAYDEDAEAGQQLSFSAFRKTGSEEAFPEEELPFLLALEGASVSEDEIEVQKTRRTVPLDMKASPIFDEDENIAFAIAAFQDITQRRQKEQEISQQNEELAAREEEMRQNLEELEATQEQMRNVRQELEANNEQFKTISRNLPGMIFQYFLDASTGEHGFSYLSDRANDLLGQAPEELQGDYKEDAPVNMPPEDLQRFQEAFVESAQNLTTFDWDGQVIRPDGTTSNLNLIAVPRLTPENNIVWDGYMHDQTEELKKERELKSSTERFHALAQNLPGMIFQYFRDSSTGEHGYSFVSDRAFDLFGLKPEEMVDDYKNDIPMDIVEEDIESFNLEFQKSFEEMVPFDWVGRVRNPEKGVIWIKVIAAPRYNEDGNIIWEGFMNDRTEEVEKEAEAQKFQSILRATMNSSSDTYLMLDNELNIMHFNEKTAEQFRRIGEEPRAGVPVFDLLPEDKHEKYRERYERVLRGEAYADETVLDSTDGQKIYYEVNYYPLRHEENQEIFGLAVISRDITKQRRQAEDLELKNTMFEKALEPQGIIEKGVYIEANQALVDLLGLDSREELVGRSPAEFTPDTFSDGRRAEEAHQQNIETIQREGHTTFRWTHLRADGTPFDCEVHASGFPYQDRFLLYVSIRDISEREERTDQQLRLQEKLLRAQRRRMSEQYAAQDLGYWEWTLSTDGVYLSPHWMEHVLGYTPGQFSEVPGRADKLLHADDLASVRQSLEELDGEAGLRQSFRMKKANGRYIKVQTEGELICDAKGKPLQVAGALQREAKK